MEQAREARRKARPEGSTSRLSSLSAKFFRKSNFCIVPKAHSKVRTCQGCAQTVGPVGDATSLS